MLLVTCHGPPPSSCALKGNDDEDNSSTRADNSVTEAVASLLVNSCSSLRALVFAVLQQPQQPYNSPWKPEIVGALLFLSNGSSD